MLIECRYKKEITERIIRCRYEKNRVSFSSRASSNIPGGLRERPSADGADGTYTAAETAVETKAAADSRLETAADTAGETVKAETAETETTEIMEEVMRIKVETNGSEIVFELNDSQAA